MMAHLIAHTKSQRFDALVDSGGFTTYFRSDIGRALGLNVEAAQLGQLKGVVDGPPANVFYHDVKLCLGENIIKIRAGFYDRLSFAGILGRGKRLISRSADSEPRPQGAIFLNSVAW